MADSQIRITADTSQAQAAIRGLTDKLDAIEGTTKKAEKSLGGLEKTTRLAVGAFAALGAAVGIREIVNIASAYTDLNSRLINATGSSEAAAQAMAAISKTADATYSSLEQTAETFLRNSMAMNELGYTTSEQIKVSEALNNALAVSATRGNQASSVLDAFAKSMATGKIQGDDFNRIIENSPRLAKALADGLSVTTGELRKMATEGKLTSDVVIPALTSQMERLREEAAAMPATINDAFIIFRNNLVKMIARLDEATGASSRVADVLVTVARNLDLVAIAAGTFMIVLAAPKIIAMARAMLVFNAAMAKNPMVLLALAAAAAATAVYEFFIANEQATDSIDKQAQAAEEAAAAANRQAEALKKTFEEQNKGLTPLFEKLRLERESTDLSHLQLSIKTKLSEAAKALKVNEDQIVSSLRQQLINEVTLTETKKLQSSLNKDSREAAQEALRLTIADKDLREQQLAVDQARLKFGEMLTQEMERQIRATVAQRQANQETLAITNARIAAERALRGEMDAAQAIQRGVGVRQRLDPSGNLGKELQMDMAALKSHLDQKLISEREYQDSVLALKSEYADRANQLYIQDAENQKRQRQTAIQAEQMRMGKTAEQARAYAEFEMKTTAEKTQFALDQAGQMFSALGAQNKKAFDAAKAFNIANAIMNTYLSVTKSLAAYPFPFNLVAAGAALAMGMAQVAQIRSQQYSGRQLGGPVMGGQSYLVGEAGPEIFTPTTTGSITRNQDIGGGGAVTVNFTINAVDTAGFDELLTERRGVIQSIIRDAMLEKGQRF
jgi:tape measure domain-containing protein